MDQVDGPQPQSENMKKIVKVESLRNGDRFEFITARSEWQDNCFLPHPQGILVVAKGAFLDPYQQCRFGYRLEKYPNGRLQDWFGVPQTEVRLLGRLPSMPLEDVRTSAKSKKAVQKSSSSGPG